MKKTLVAYYSHTGSNEYLAKKTASVLGCDVEEIRPRAGAYFFVFVSSLLKISPGFLPFKHEPQTYERVILCGPIWMGMFLAPLRDFVRKYNSKINEFCFLTCCGSVGVAKEGKFSFTHVFSIARKCAGREEMRCEALPIPLVVPKEKIGDGTTIMNTRLSDLNFNGEIERRFNDFIKSLD